MESVQSLVCSRGSGPKLTAPCLSEWVNSDSKRSQRGERSVCVVRVRQSSQCFSTQEEKCWSQGRSLYQNLQKRKTRVGGRTWWTRSEIIFCIFLFWWRWWRKWALKVRIVKIFTACFFFNPLRVLHESVPFSPRPIVPKWDVSVVDFYFREALRFHPFLFPVLHVLTACWFSSENTLRNVTHMHRNTNREVVFCYVLGCFFFSYSSHIVYPQSTYST